MAPARTRKLSRSELGGLAARGITVPTYDLDAVSVGHVHIGPGVFHRAHQAVHAERLLNAGHRHAAIAAISLRSAALRDALAGQDLLYMFVEQDADECAPALIGALREVLVAEEDPLAAIERLADPAVTVVTTTVTEAGYCFTPIDRQLDMANAGVLHDVADPDRSTTMPGLVAAALARRRERGITPFAVVPCDNIQGNGELAKTVVSQLAAARDPRLGEWIAGEVPFCSTMVDRIVPGTRDADRRLVAELTGVEDAWPVMTEPFSQWVVELQPGADLSVWADAGVQLVGDVGDYERLKLQVLNATHSALAYLGMLNGHATIGAAIADPGIDAFIERLLENEIIPAVVPPVGVDVSAYSATTLTRFANPALEFSVAKVAGDGSLKLTQRFLPTVEVLLAGRRPIDGTATVFAAWMWCLLGPTSTDLAVIDPLSASLRHVVAGNRGEPLKIVDQVLRDAGVFGPPGRDERFVEAVARRAEQVWADPRGALAS